MSGFIPYVFTPQQLTDIRRFCGFSPQSNGQVLFPEPWIYKIYLALDYRLLNLSLTEGAVVVNSYLTPLAVLEAAIPAAAANLNIGTAGPYQRNPKEMRERRLAFDDWRLRLCQFLGIQPGPELNATSGGTIRLIV